MSNLAKTKIIFLNGVSSVGKTSIAKMLQIILDDAYLPTGPVGKKVMKGMRQAIASLANQGNNLIIDEVIIVNEMEEYAQLVASFQIFYIGVFAPIKVIEAREHSRQNRLIGLARWQYDRVHKNKSYDLKIDTTSLSPMDCAKLIKHKLNL
ncbi:MAG: hypothetical protein REH83_06695 [Rickettsiella sp.]|nr:hypothetical protein [Rickettsiella sp.]